MRILLILKRAVSSLFRFSEYRKQFGTRAALWMMYVYVFPSQRKKRYQNFLKYYFEEDLRKIVCKFQSKELMRKEYTGKIPVWICWLGGYEKMPEVVKICFESLKNNIPMDVSEIKLITDDNYNKYISLPEYIIEKYSNGLICPAHFSDIIRFCLLSQYGGMWIDATVYVSGHIPKEYLLSDFYTQKVEDRERYICEPSRAQWCGFILAGRPCNLLFEFLKDSLFEYWKKYDYAIDYIFFDYMILCAYNNVEKIHNMIEENKANNEQIWKMWDNINNEFSKTEYEELCQHNIFHKLSYKISLKEQENGRITWYGYIKGVYNENKCDNAGL